MQNGDFIEVVNVINVICNVVGIGDYVGIVDKDFLIDEFLY